MEELNLIRNKINKKNWTFEDKETKRKGFLTYENQNDALTLSYVYFFIDKDEYQDGAGKKISVIYVENQKAYDIVLDLMKSGEAPNFWDAVLMVEEAFSKKNDDLFKFRGDLAEAIYCYVKDAEKNMDDSMTSDVVQNGKSIEIKSLSINKMEFTASREQIENNISTSAVFLSLFDREEGGMSIVDVANSFDDSNANFKKYLLDTYNDTNLGTRYTYRVDEEIITDITDIIYKSVNSDNIVSATFRVPRERFDIEKENAKKE